jgi:hypothetical protein
MSDDKKGLSDLQASGVLVVAILVLIGSGVLLHINNKDAKNDKFGLRHHANGALGAILYAAFFTILAMIARLFDNKFNRNRGEDVDERNIAGAILLVGLVIAIIILGVMTFHALKHA